MPKKGSGKGKMPKPSQTQNLSGKKYAYLGHFRQDKYIDMGHNDVDQQLQIAPVPDYGAVLRVQQQFMEQEARRKEEEERAQAAAAEQGGGGMGGMGKMMGGMGGMGGGGGGMSFG